MSPSGRRLSRRRKSTSQVHKVACSASVECMLTCAAQGPLRVAESLPRLEFGESPASPRPLHAGADASRHGCVPPARRELRRCGRQRLRPHDQSVIDTQGRPVQRGQTPSKQDARRSSPASRPAVATTLIAPLRLSCDRSLAFAVWAAAAATGRRTKWAASSGEATGTGRAPERGRNVALP